MEKQMDTSYTPNSYAVKQASGDSATCIRLGAVLVEVSSPSFSIIPLWSSYYMPTIPQHTLRHQALKRYSHFKAVNTEALEWIQFIDSNNNKIKLPSLPEYHKT
eukprot:10731076-Ditylum_brightwellii.AAC.1